MCQVISDSNDSRWFPFLQRVGKGVAKTSFTNEFKVATIGAPVRYDVHELWDI